MLSIMVCLRGPVFIPRFVLVPVPAVRGGKMLGRAVLPAPERVCSGEGKLSSSKTPLHRINPNTNCLESCM